MGMCALYEGCAASLVGPILEDSWRPTQNTDRLRPASSSLTTIHRTVGLVVPSIAHGTISLCFMEQSQS
jgi:hypothetical protein